MNTMDADRKERRDTIASILRTQAVGTQEELGELLAKKGFEVTQATLSRDLAKLKARRLTLSEGGSVYELEDMKAPAEEDVLQGLRHLLINVDHNDSLVVMTTAAGGASAVANGLDRARLNSILGTIAGDDTIFVAPTRKVSAAALAKQLQNMWRRKDS